MARAAAKRGKQAEQPPEDDEDSPASSALDDIEDELEESMAADLQAALAECGDTGQVRIQVIKISPKDEAGACTTYDSGEINIDRLRDEYGAGTYSLMFRNPKGQLLTRKRLSIVGKKQEPTKPVTTTDIAKLLEGGGTAASNNQFLLMLKMMEMQSQQMVAVLSRPAPAAPVTPPMGPQEIIAMMTGLATIMKPAVPPESPMDAMLKGVKLAKDLGGGDKDDGGIVGLVSKGLDVIPGLIQQQPPQPVVSPPQRVEVRQLPPSAPAQPAAPAPTYQGKTPQENDMFAKLVWLRARVSSLVEKARLNRDPSLYADLMLDELPDFITVEEIRERMSDATWYSQLCQLNSEVARYEEWFKEFHASLMQTFAEVDASTETAAPNTEVNGAQADEITDGTDTTLN